MAVVWAKSNGSWATASLWAFWNESTQQIEDYGQTPQVDDIVYLNGHVVQVSVATYTYLQVAEIHNDLNLYTEQIGGYVDIANSINHYQQLMITCDWFGYGANDNYYILRACVDVDNSRRNTNITFVGNINNSYFRADVRAATSWTINGNVTNAIVYMRHATTGASKTITINGNVTSFIFKVSNVNENTLTINGNVAGIIDELIIGNGTRVCRINGSVTLSSGNLFTTNLQVNGIIDMSELATIDNITYPFANNCGIINYGDLTIKTTKLVDYPSPANVKKDIPYAFNQMVGTYDINQYLPPESVVLKDYKYGDSDDRKTGTMENEVIVEVDNTNTINVFPYKRRRNG